MIRRGFGIDFDPLPAPQMLEAIYAIDQEQGKQRILLAVKRVVASLKGEDTNSKYISDMLRIPRLSEDIIAEIIEIAGEKCPTEIVGFIGACNLGRTERELSDKVRDVAIRKIADTGRLLLIPLCYKTREDVRRNEEHLLRAVSKWIELGPSEHRNRGIRNFLEFLISPNDGRNRLSDEMLDQMVDSLAKNGFEEVLLYISSQEAFSTAIRQRVGILLEAIALEKGPLTPIVKQIERKAIIGRPKRSALGQKDPQMRKIKGKLN